MKIKEKDEAKYLNPKMVYLTDEQVRWIDEQGLNFSKWVRLRINLAIAEGEKE